MGRHAAGESFLHAYCRYGDADTLYCYAADQDHLRHFKEKVRGINESTKCNWIPRSAWSGLTEPGLLFLPGPDLTNLAWLRQTKDLAGFSMCGITHTTASHAAMDAIGSLLTAPLQPWDALICTSQAVKTTVDKILSDYADYLQHRFSMPKKPSTPVQLPVIPLGINCDSFSKHQEEGLRLQWRSKLAIDSHAVVALFVGRLSYHAKSHPQPMFLALEAASKRTGKAIHLIMAGWAHNQAIQDDFVSAAKILCPSVQVTFLDGRKESVRKTSWYAADFFKSLSDNIQETFGLTPVEAMSAGLPVVISNWNGYRETVRDGVNGYLIDTCMPKPNEAPSLAPQYADGTLSYDRYIGYVSQTTAVDIRQCSQACAALVDDAALRAKLSAAAREHARQTYDWRVIIPQYLRLFEQLSSARAGAGQARNAV